jgi:hypothetical protein
VKFGFSVPTFGGFDERVLGDLAREAETAVVVSPFGGDPGPYEEAGATWWIGGVGPEESVATARERIDVGPPR